MNPFTHDLLRADDYTGFVPLKALDHTAVTTNGGVYMVLRAPDLPPVFRDTSTGGWFKDKDPTVEVSALHGKWIEGCSVLYIGKATSLRKRLRQFANFGQGKPIGHWGGRYIWQLADSDDLLVCWKATAEDPRAAEQALLADFRARYGRLPFANLIS